MPLPHTDAHPGLSNDPVIDWLLDADPSIRWWSNLYTLLFLRDLGLDPTSARARTAIDLVRRNVTWGPEFGDSPFFEGEIEPCINGHVVALGA